MSFMKLSWLLFEWLKFIFDVVVLSSSFSVDENMIVVLLPLTKVSFNTIVTIVLRLLLVRVILDCCQYTSAINNIYNYSINK